MHARALTLLLLAVSTISALAGDLGSEVRAAIASGNYQEAARLYRQAIAAGNDSPELRSNLGLVLHLSGNNREAVEQFRIALRQKPALASANLYGGLTEVDLGEAKQALPLLEKARELDPRSPAPLLALGKVFVALRDYGRANDSYAKAAQLDRKLAEAWYGVGITDRSLAEQVLHRLARSSPSAGNAALQKQAKDRLAEALQALQRAVALDPSSSRQHLILAESFSEAGRLVEAVPEYQAAIRLDPKSDAAALGLATAYWRQRQFPDALPLLKRVLSASPKDPEANAMLADILEHDGDRDGAVLHAKTALAGNPDIFQAHVVLGRVYLAEGAAKLAIAELRQIETADPDGSYHFLLFRAYKQAGDEEGARASLAAYERLRHRDQ